MPEVQSSDSEESLSSFSDDANLSDAAFWEELWQNYLNELSQLNNLSYSLIDQIAS